MAKESAISVNPEQRKPSLGTTVTAKRATPDSEKKDQGQVSHCSDVGRCTASASNTFRRRAHAKLHTTIHSKTGTVSPNLGYGLATMKLFKQLPNSSQH